jgi:hypothetical protein
MKTTSPCRTITAYKARFEIEAITAKQMRYFVAEVPVECQWYTRCKREIRDGSIVFTLYGDILIPPQQVHAQKVDMEPKDTMNMWMEHTNLLKQTGLSDVEADDITNQDMAAAWCWCHSHVNMAATPSKEDEEQWQTWVKLNDQSKKATAPPAMLILNKNDEIFVRVYDKETLIQFENIPVVVHPSTEPDLAYVQAAIKTKLTEMKKPEKPPQTQPIVPAYGGYNNRAGGYMHTATQTHVGKTTSTNGKQQALWKPPVTQTKPKAITSQNFFTVLTEQEVKTLTSIFDSLRKNNPSDSDYKRFVHWVEGHCDQQAFTTLGMLLFTNLTEKEFLQVLNRHNGKAETEIIAKVISEITDYDLDYFLDLMDLLVASYAYSINLDVAVSAFYATYINASPPSVKVW